MNKFINSHTSRFIIQTRFDEEYDHNTDKELRDYKRKLRVTCIKERHKYRLAQTHAYNKQDMKEAYRTAVDELFLEQIIGQFPKSEKLIALTEDVLVAQAISPEDTETISSLLEKIKKENSEVATALTGYLEKADKAAVTLEKIGSLPKYKSFDDFVLKMDKRYNSKGELIAQ
jgi:hypothetical protein